MFAASFRAGDLALSPFSSRDSPWLDHRRPAPRHGCTVFPGGIGQTEQQVQAMGDLRPDAYVGTPSLRQDTAGEGG
ncbi:MAG: hypothetical protein IPO00_07480 [Betaproteobacteria bacterium]|nr:hypothetical protein [Betaproteobacteria bacterium]